MIFREKFKPIEIEVENMKGKPFKLKTQFCTSGQMGEMEKILATDEKKEKNEEGEIEIKKITGSERIHKILSIKFGEKESFWSQFSQELLNEIMLYVQEKEKKN